VLGAGGGGCLLFVAPPERHERINHSLRVTATKHALHDASVIPFSFVHSGVELVVNTKE